MRLITFLVFFLSFLAAKAQESTDAKLDALNQEFRRQYGVARDENLAAMWRDFLGDISRKETGGSFYPGLAQ